VTTRVVPGPGGPVLSKSGGFGGFGFGFATG
jgi:hypothetical protein